MTRKGGRLSRELIVEQAVSLADEAGMERLTIRRLADALAVGPMSIYHYFPNKDAIIDAMVDSVFSQIALPPSGKDWKSAMRVRCVSARKVLNRHPWAPPYMESRTSPGPATLRHHDAVLGCLRDGGLSMELTAHAYAIVDSYLYGFALEEAALPSGGGEGIQELAEEMAAAFDPEAYPNLTAFAVEHVMQPGYSFANSFTYGLDLIIDGLDQASRQGR
ncbi:MAG: TetR/AcrR family transcriptional regulator [Thermoanaerobaculales bacterium]